MLVKLAAGNVRRSARDVSIYFVTLAFAVCLLYSFLASTDYLLALDLSVEQRARYVQAGGVLAAFSVFTVVIFLFLVCYATAFLVRRRRREFGMYALLGMGAARVSLVLFAESVLVGLASLGAGIALGAALSPVFGLVAAFVFGAVWQPVAVFSGSAAVQTAGAFAGIALVAAARAARGVARRPLVELMHGTATPERRVLTGGTAARAQAGAAVALLALVWGVCLLSPGYFIVFIIPLGFVALGGTYLLFRVLAVRAPERLRACPERYWSGLAPFTLRSLEARAESGCMALAAVCVLVAAGMCLMVAGFSFSVGLRGGTLFKGASTGMEPIAFACVFYGLAFLIAGAAVLALQQLSQASDAQGAYRTLDRLGAERASALASLRAQVGVCFAVPVAMACVHCVFGFTLIGILTLLTGVAGYGWFVAGTLALTLVLFALYFAVTCAVVSAGMVRRIRG